MTDAITPTDSQGRPPMGLALWLIVALLAVLVALIAVLVWRSWPPDPKARLKQLTAAYEAAHGEEKCALAHDAQREALLVEPQSDDSLHWSIEAQGCDLDLATGKYP